MSRLAVAVLGVAPGLVLAGCVADEDANPARGCDSDVDCAAEQMCYRGFCVIREPDGGFDAGPVRRDSGAGDPDAGGDDDAGGGDDAGDAEDSGSPECRDGTVEACYTGDAATRGVGECADGERTCTSGTWGVCMGEATPVAEICNEADDDCDGSTDEDFSLATDALHCGACSRACSAGESCCRGACVDTNMDEGNCGECGMSCSRPDGVCCAGTCRRSC